MDNIAILLTVYNRKNVTINGITTLFSIMKMMKDFHFEVFMTNDGCTDGTEEEVAALFPSIHIINCSGQLYWSRGMNVAWRAAVRYGKFDYFIWFNDDAELYPEALLNLFKPLSVLGKRTIIVGAFRSSEGVVSYGGRNCKMEFIEPKEENYPSIYFMNGNWVLIPQEVFEEIGYITAFYKHGHGDWDYGFMALKKGINVVLTDKYVGETNRRDVDIPDFFNSDLSLLKRFRILYSPKNNPFDAFYFHLRHISFFYAVRKILATHIYVLFPNLFHV